MRYDYGKVTEVLNDAVSWLGEERFSEMRVTELEKLIRDRERTVPLPARSQFRAAIHEFRVKRWPAAAPRKRT